MPFGEATGGPGLVTVYVSPFVGSYGTPGGVADVTVKVCWGLPYVTVEPIGRPVSVPVAASYVSVTGALMRKPELAAPIAILPVPVFAWLLDAVAGDDAAISA